MLVSASILAFSPIFWLYAHVAEVFQLLNVLVLVSLYFLILWYQQGRVEIKKRKRGYRNLYLSIFFLGLAFFHHHTVILLLPAWLYLIHKSDKVFFLHINHLLKLVVVFLSGFVPYLFIPLAVVRDIPIKWDNPTNLVEFIRLITRADYGTFVANSELIGFSIVARFINVFWYFKVLKTDFTWLGIFLFLIGLYYLYRHKRELFWFLILAVFFSGPFFFMYASFPPFRDFILGTLERFFMLSYLFWVVVLGFGLRAVIYKIRDLVKIKCTKELARMIITSCFLLIPFSFFTLNYSKSDLSEYVLGKTLSEDLLGEADPPGIIFLEGDTIVFSTQYSYYVDKVSSNSVVVLAGSLKHPYYREIFKKQYPFLLYPDSFLDNISLSSGDVANELIKLNADRYPIYSNVKPDVVPKDYAWINEGILGRFYKTELVPTDREIAEKLERNINKIKFKKELIEGQYLHLIPAHIIDIYKEYFIQAGYFLLNRNLSDEAYKFFDLVLELENDNIGALIAKGDIYMFKNSCDEAKNYYNRALIERSDRVKFSIYTRLGDLYKKCYEDDQTAVYYFKKAEEIAGISDEFIE